MKKISSQDVVRYYLAKKASQKSGQPRIKTAGEVVFRKDTSSDANAWAHQGIPPEKRKIHSEFAYNPKNMKMLAVVLRATSVALGHAMSAQNKFAKLKSALISPDGALGGKGYIMTIPDIRKQYYQIVEALSRITDTLYDEMHAPHWAPISRQKDDESKEEVAQILKDTEEVKENPQLWAEENMKEEFDE